MSNKKRDDKGADVARYTVELPREVTHVIGFSEAEQAKGAKEQRVTFVLDGLSQAQLIQLIRHYPVIQWRDAVRKLARAKGGSYSNAVIARGLTVVLKDVVGKRGGGTRSFDLQKWIIAGRPEEARPLAIASVRELFRTLRESGDRNSAEALLAYAKIDFEELDL